MFVKRKSKLVFYEVEPEMTLIKLTPSSDDLFLLSILAIYNSARKLGPLLLLL